MQKIRKNRYLPEQVIISVMSGNGTAMENVIGHYDWFIGYMLDVLVRSYQLDSKLVPIDDMKQEIRTELYKSLKNFT